MKGDFTRLTFDPARRYGGVRMQQGRVLLDADWNEQLDIQRRLDARSTADAMGAYGVPASAPTSFQVYINSNAPWIRAGRIYVDGVLCENDGDRAIAALPDSAEGLPGFGTYLCFLDVWQTGVTALEDPSIREVGLHGADTATRDRTVWQVRWAPFTPGADDAVDPIAWITQHQLRRTSDLATMTARVRDGEATGFASCAVPTTAGYQRQENLLYRVEVHAGGVGGAAKIKWSRDNGATAARCTGLNNTVPATPALTLGGVERDRFLAFEVGDHIELITDAREVARAPGSFARIVDRDVDSLRLDIELLAGEPALTGWFDDPSPGVTDGRKVRRWEGAPVTVSAAVTEGKSNEVALGSHGTDDGIVLQFKVDAGGALQFHVGDYWLVPARASTGAIEWPRSGASAAFLRPHGPAHRYAPLALLEYVAGGEGTWEMRRDYLFHARCPPLATMRQLAYRGEAIPVLGEPGQFDLSVAVVEGSSLVAGAQVRFQADRDCDLLNGATWQAEPLDVDATSGVASCRVKLRDRISEGMASAVLRTAIGPNPYTQLQFRLHSPRFRLLRQALLFDLDAERYLSADAVTGAVTTWKGLSGGEEVTLSQGGSGAQPTRVHGVFAGRDVVRFERGAKYMEATAGMSLIDRELVTVYAVGITVPDASNDWLVRRQAPSHALPRWGVQYVGNTKVKVTHNGDEYDFILTSLLPPRVPAVWSFKSSRSEFFRNESAIPLDLGGEPADLGALGMVHDGSLIVGGGAVDVARVLIYDGAHNAADKRAVLAYLAQEYGVLLDRAA